LELCVIYLWLHAFPSSVVMYYVLALRYHEALGTWGIMDAEAHIARLDCTHHTAKGTRAIPVVGHFDETLTTWLIGTLMMDSA